MGAVSFGREEGIVKTRFYFDDLRTENDAGVRCHNKFTAFFLSCMGKITEYRHKDGTVTYFNANSLNSWAQRKAPALNSPGTAPHAHVALALNAPVTDLNDFLAKYFTVQADQQLLHFTKTFTKEDYPKYQDGITKLQMASKYEVDDKLKANLSGRITVLRQLAPRYESPSEHDLKAMDVKTSMEFIEDKIVKFKAQVEGWEIDLGSLTRNGKDSYGSLCNQIKNLKAFLIILNRAKENDCLGDKLTAEELEKIFSTPFVIQSNPQYFLPKLPQRVNDNLNPLLSELRNSNPDVESTEIKLIQRLQKIYQHSDLYHACSHINDVAQNVIKHAHNIDTGKIAAAKEQEGRKIAQAKLKAQKELDNQAQQAIKQAEKLLALNKVSDAQQVLTNTYITNPHQSIGNCLKVMYKIQEAIKPYPNLLTVKLEDLATQLATAFEKTLKDITSVFVHPKKEAAASEKELAASVTKATTTLKTILEAFVKNEDILQQHHLQEAIRLDGVAIVTHFPNDAYYVSFGHHFQFSFISNLEKRIVLAKLASALDQTSVDTANRLKISWLQVKYHESITKKNIPQAIQLLEKMLPLYPYKMGEGVTKCDSLKNLQRIIQEHGVNVQTGQRLTPEEQKQLAEISKELAETDLTTIEFLFYMKAITLKERFSGVLKKYLTDKVTYQDIEEFAKVDKDFVDVSFTASYQHIHGGIDSTAISIYNSFMPHMSRLKAEPWEQKIIDSETRITDQVQSQILAKRMFHYASALHLEVEKCKKYKAEITKLIQERQFDQAQTRLESIKTEFNASKDYKLIDLEELNNRVAIWQVHLKNLKYYKEIADKINQTYSGLKEKLQSKILSLQTLGIRSNAFKDNETRSLADNFIENLAKIVASFNGCEHNCETYEDNSMKRKAAHIHYTKDICTFNRNDSHISKAISTNPLLKDAYDVLVGGDSTHYGTGLDSRFYWSKYPELEKEILPPVLLLLMLEACNVLEEDAKKLMIPPASGSAAAKAN